MTERTKTENELTVTLTKMVENSRAILKSELKITLLEDRNITQEVIGTTLALIDEDCDNKLDLIPGVIKGMLDLADTNAQKMALESI